jgi:hypothetical protein
MMLPGRARTLLVGLMAGAAVSACAGTTSGQGAARIPSTRAIAPAASSSAAAGATDAPSSPAQVRPAKAATRTPCTGNDRPKWVFVALQRQHMWLCHRHRVALSTAITSGMVGPYTHTPTGRYRVQGLNRNSTLTLNTGATYQVKFWIPFNAPLFGFHDSPWQHFPYGSPRYRTHGSHGCIHMPLAAIRFFYNWADIGTPVLIKG